MVTLLESLLAGGRHLPTSVVKLRPPKDLWEMCDRASREVATWPRWKRRAADQALVSHVGRSPRGAPKR